MTIYDVLFYQKGLSVAQILVTDTDFKVKVFFPSPKMILLRRL